jgi:phospholipid-transporting ATPase
MTDCKAKDIKVGCFVKVLQDEYFPCDLILLNSSLPKGIAYIETKGLDGETNLKAKQASSETVKLADDLPNVVRNFTGVNLECDLPNSELYKF